MTVSTTSSELLIFLPPNVVWWYIIISQRVLWGNWIAVFKVKVTAKLQNANECFSRQYLQNHWTFYHQVWFGDASSWSSVFQKWLVCCHRGEGHSEGSYYKNMNLVYLLNFWSFPTKLLLMAHHNNLDCLEKDLVAVKVTGKVQNASECSPGGYLLSCWMFVTKNMVMHHHEPVVFKVMVTVMSIESLCILYLLYHWSLGNQTRCADILTTNPSTTMWAYTDSNTLTLNYRMGGGGGQGNQTLFCFHCVVELFFFFKLELLEDLLCMFLTNWNQTSCDLFFVFVFSELLSENPDVFACNTQL